MHQSDTISRQANARQLYARYAFAGLEHPELVHPDYDAVKTGDRVQFERYKVYVENLLFAYDEIFNSGIGDPEWRTAFVYDLQPHLAYICDERDPALLNQFYPITRSIVVTEMNLAKATIPECRRSE